MTRDPDPTGFAQITELDGTRHAAMPQDRLRAIRHGAEALRERLLDAPPVHFARSFNLLRIPYPAWFAFTGVYSQQLLKPHMVHLLARRRSCGRAAWRVPSSSVICAKPVGSGSRVMVVSCVWMRGLPGSSLSTSSALRRYRTPPRC